MNTSAQGDSHDLAQQTHGVAITPSSPFEPADVLTTAGIFGALMWLPT